MTYSIKHVSNKTEDLNLGMLNIIAGINESKALTRHVSCKCKCKLDGRKCDSNQKQNNNKCEWKKHQICEKDHIQNPATFTCKNVQYLASIVDDSVITCDEVIDKERTKTVTTNFKEKNAICESKKIYILLTFFINFNINYILNSCQYLQLPDKI